MEERIIPSVLFSLDALKDALTYVGVFRSVIVEAFTLPEPSLHCVQRYVVRWPRVIHLSISVSAFMSGYTAAALVCLPPLATSGSDDTRYWHTCI